MRLACVLSLLAFLAAGCARGGASDDEKTLNLYVWSEYVPQALLDEFTRQTGIQVFYDTYSSNEEMLERVQSGAVAYDIIQPSDYTAALMINKGMLTRLDMERIPNFKNLDPVLTNPYYDPGNQYTVIYQWGTAALVYNAAKVQPDPVSWSVLWDPQYKERVLLVDDMREVLGLALMSLGEDRNSTNPADLEAARQRLLELAPNIKRFTSDGMKDALLSEEVWLGLVWSGEAVQAAQENPEIRYICPIEGCSVYYDTLAIPKNAPHPDAAHQFINFVLSPEASILITQEFSYSSPNRAALELLEMQDPELYAAYMASPATHPTFEEMARMYPALDIGEAGKLWESIWAEIRAIK